MSSNLLPHEKAGRVIRLLSYLAIIACLGIAAAIAIPQLNAPSPTKIPMWQIFGIFAGVLLFPAFLFYLGGAVKQHEPWARIVGIIYGVLLLSGFPIGTIVGIYLIWLLGFKWSLQPEPDPSLTPELGICERKGERDNEDS